MPPSTATPVPQSPAAVPLVDLAAQYRSIGAEIEEVVRDVMARGDFTLSSALEQFEGAFAAYCETDFALGVANGTDAIHLALKALGVGPGDEVIVPSMTFAATAEPLVYLGAKPVFVDVRADDFQIDPVAVERAVTPRTRGVIAVHLYGIPADVKALAAVVEKHGIWLLEDAAQAHGAQVDERRVGSFGAAACFSFYPSKNLGAYGDGGAVATSDPRLADRIRSLRHHGQRERYVHSEIGYCSRLDNLQAAILNVKLRHLDEWNRQRQTAAARYDELIGDRLERVGSERREGAVHHVYAVRVKRGQRDRVLAELQRRGIGAGVHYPIPVHAQPAFRDIGLGGESLPITDRAAREELSLPIYPEITAEQQERVVSALLSAVEGA